MDKKLKPIHFKDEYSEEIQKHIEYYLYSLIYKDLVDYLTAELGLSFKNSKTTKLTDALTSGKIVYIDGYFTGSFNSKTSAILESLGAKWSRLRKGYRLPLTKIPMDVRGAIGVGTARLIEKQKKISKILDGTAQNAGDLTYSFDFSDQLGRVLTNLDLKFVETTKSSIEIAPDFSGGMRKIITDQYNENMNLSIKRWQDEAIIRLRSKVEDNMREGLRADTLQQIIMQEFGASSKKARFLALQETSLITALYRKERYKDVGIKQYKWSTSNDGRVRQDHKDLNGKIFDWDNPPITNKSTGARNHPSEDYGCRCVPIPIVK